MAERRLPDGGMFNKAQWKISRNRAIATLDHVCALCHKPIDMEAKQYEPLSVEVDHITPISRGGHPYELSNLQLSHSRCNRAKGNRMAIDYGAEQETVPVPISNAW